MHARMHFIACTHDFIACVRVRAQTYVQDLIVAHGATVAAYLTRMNARVYVDCCFVCSFRFVC